MSDYQLTREILVDYILGAPARRMEAVERDAETQEPERFASGMYVLKDT